VVKEQNRDDQLSGEAYSIFATIVGIGWCDSRGSPSLFGKYTTSIAIARQPRAPSAGRGGEEAQQEPSAPAL
jgi:hypothetical protein